MLFLVFTMSNIVFAQVIMSTNKKAIKLYDQGKKLISDRDFYGAIAKFNDAIQKDSSFAEAYRQAGAAYTTLSQHDSALVYYTQLAKRFPDEVRYAGSHLKLAQAEFSDGNYEHALRHAYKYLSLRTNKDRYSKKAETIIANCEFALLRINNPLSFNPRPLAYPLNQYQQQYFPVLSADLTTLFFIKRDASEEIYTASRLADGSWTVPAPIDSAITSEYNEGTCSVSADGRTLVFTSCMRKDGFGSCDLYITYKTGDSWSTPENIGRPVNSSAWDSQPALSADGRTLYYVSNRKGSLGKRDIWVSYFSDETGWSNPKNLGKSINTKGDDISPFIHVNGASLYFASNGRTGFGGFDIYYTNKTESKAWEEPMNFGYPINTHNDELAMFISADGTSGFYSHETQQQNKLLSKLYQIDIPQEISVKLKSSFVHGIIYDSLTKMPVEASVQLVNLNVNNEITRATSDNITGEYLIVLTEGAAYALYITAPEYLFKSYHFDLDKDSIGIGGVIANIALSPLRKGEKTTLNNVLFNHDSFRLTEKSKKALLFVGNYLSGNPGLNIEIAGHTDNIGAIKYNLNLSKNRAFEVYKYLIDNGVGEERIAYKGYGSSIPIDVNNTEQGRANNRRIEFIISE